jgi:uncharacterized phage-associated protein
MYNPITISNFFIQEYGGENEITPMRLVKLVYLSHGWYLGLTGDALIDQNPEAWQYGPVIPSVYHHYKHYRSSPIKNSNHFINPCDEINQTDQKFLRSVWDTYQGHSALDLSALTHQVNTPWFITWNNLSHNSSALGINNKQIPDNLIKKHYQEKIELLKKESQEVS